MGCVGSSSSGVSKGVRAPLCRARWLTIRTRLVPAKTSHFSAKVLDQQTKKPTRNCTLEVTSKALKLYHPGATDPSETWEVRARRWVSAAGSPALGRLTGPPIPSLVGIYAAIRFRQESLYLRGRA